MSMCVIVLSGRQQVIGVSYRTAVHAWQMAKQQGSPVEFPTAVDGEYITVDPASEIRAIWGKDEAPNLTTSEDPNDLGVKDGEQE